MAALCSRIACDPAVWDTKSLLLIPGLERILEVHAPHHQCPFRAVAHNSAISRPGDFVELRRLAVYFLSQCRYHLRLGASAVRIAHSQYYSAFFTADITLYVSRNSC